MSSALPPPVPPAHSRWLHLLDLPDSALASIAKLLPFCERLRLSLVCRALRRLCAGPSDVWHMVEAVAELPFDEEAGEAQRLSDEMLLLERVARWLGPRLAAVHVLDFAVFSSVPIDPGELTLLPVVELLFSKCPAGQPLPLAKLSIEWPEAVLLRADFTPPNAPRLHHLHKLAFPTVGRLEVAACLPPDLALTDFSLQDGTLWSDRGTLAAAWLPPTVTALHLSSVGLRALPQVLTQLPHLRSLVLNYNRLTGASNLAILEQLARLEDLNLSECFLPRFPDQVSALTGLRLLYLHNAFNRNVRVPLAAWSALAPLRRLVFLSISGNQLQQLPPCVAGLTQLQCLHVEENEFEAGLPLHPYLRNLRELVMDWQAALDSPTSLQAATALSRLVLCNHRAVDEGPGPGLTVRSAEAAEPLLSVLSVMPALRAVEDVFGEEESVTAPVARVMWQLGRRCPHLQLKMLPSTDVGWTLHDTDRLDSQR